VRTALIIVAGVVLLGVMALVARYMLEVSMARAALVFLPVWLVIIVFATATIPSFAAYAGGAIPIVILVALFVTFSA